ncbi:recombinase family protein [Klebsiella pneumoniae]|uniref:recombinase family protein n=2 Tax=Klebsiella pneumoniae TaxID=573 RepID=UPI0032C1AD3E
MPFTRRPEETRNNFHSHQGQNRHKCASYREIYTHLMAIFSSFERNRNIERTRSGLAAARARGRVGGRKPSLSEEDVKQIRILLADPEMTVGAVAKRFNVSRMTIYRYTTKS